ncbi:hypothetical protein [Paenibacillus contaminans]|uniref:Uncharacterized protein n=1 Tax=Paenibacillus contaminans TaxID=450362 RepID=A0A329MSE5_9BACL|nr:hypothetical protein [Paenibacillus contaminans]RAV22899.1 hypothetical protein DQG23_01450 [Paenibacillus contaminans]
MAHHSNTADEELLLPPPSEQIESVLAVPQKPKLTMKYLSERILELQRENDGLAARLEALEKQSSDGSVWNMEVAAAQSPFLANANSPKIGSAPPLPELIREVSAPGSRHNDVMFAKEAFAAEERTGFPRSALIPRSEKYPVRQRKVWGIFRFFSRFW